MKKKRKTISKKSRVLPKPKIKKDISRQTVAAILVLAILISVLGTWFILDSITTTQKPTPQLGSTIAKGKVSIELKEPIKQSAPSSGRVSIQLS